MAEQTEVNVPCNDYAAFQEALKTMREIDDKIIYKLNRSIPTLSFSGQVDAAETCKGLYGELSVAHSRRGGAIKKCIRKASDSVADLRAQREKDPDNFDVIKHLRTEQRKLRTMQSEVNIEEIIRERTLKVFHERCRTHYIPPKST